MPKLILSSNYLKNAPPSHLTNYMNYHFVNIGNTPIQYVILQVIYATAIGIIYAITFSKMGSLLLCMVSHALVDFIGSWGESMNPNVEIIGATVCVICALYCWFIRKKEYVIKT